MRFEGSISLTEYSKEATAATRNPARNATPWYTALEQRQQRARPAARRRRGSAALAAAAAQQWDELVDRRLRVLPLRWCVVVHRCATVPSRRAVPARRLIRSTVARQRRRRPASTTTTCAAINKRAVCGAVGEGTMTAGGIIWMATWGQKCWNSAARATWRWCIAPLFDCSTTTKLSTVTFRWERRSALFRFASRRGYPRASATFLATPVPGFSLSLSLFLSLACALSFTSIGIKRKIRELFVILFCVLRSCAFPTTDFQTRRDATCSKQGQCGKILTIVVTCAIAILKNFNRPFVNGSIRTIPLLAHSFSITDSS